MSGYYTGYCYCGRMPNGRDMYFATEDDYHKYYEKFYSGDDEETEDE